MFFPTTELASQCPTPPGVFYSSQSGATVLAPCKRWCCPVCGPRSARRFAARVRRTPSYTYFITLTSLPHGAVTAQLVKKFNACWRAWLQWLKRELTVGAISWVLERGKKTGHLHRHVAIETSKSFSYKRARAALVRTGHGAVCDFAPFRIANSGPAAAGYLAKYLAKEMAAPGRFPRYSRRCQSSTPVEKRDGDYDYKFKAWGGHWRSTSQDSVLDSHRMPRQLADDDPRVLTIALNQKEKLHHGGSTNVGTVDESGSPSP